MENMNWIDTTMAAIERIAPTRTIENGRDITDICTALRAAGYDPESLALSWESSSDCLDGSCTMTVYKNGKHIASAFCPAI